MRMEEGCWQTHTTAESAVQLLGYGCNFGNVALGKQHNQLNTIPYISKNVIGDASVQHEKQTTESLLFML